MSRRSTTRYVIAGIASRLRGRDSQLRYLSQSVRMEEAVSAQVVRATMLLVGIAAVAFLAWSAVTNINEVARSSGSIVPSGYVQVVQHLEGGVVKNILVKEGDLVGRGDILVQLEGAAARRDLSRLQAKQMFLDLQVERLRALVERRQPNFAAIAPQDPDLAVEQQRIFDGMQRAYQTQKQIIQNQIAQKQELLAILSARTETVTRNIALSKEARDRKKQLLKNGLTSRFGYMKTEEELNNATGEKEELRIKQLQVYQELAEFENRLISLEASNHDEAYRDLDKVQSEAFQNREGLATLEDRVGRLDVRAPTRGYVKGLSVNTIGAVIGSGTTLMEIVPTEGALTAEIRIHPRDIGHVRVGQPVRLKFSSFDFARYGTVEARLASISATTFVDDRGDTFYLGRVPLERGYLGANPNENTILPGMTVEADVITGGKTILSYLLKPIHTSLNSALTER